jgi:arylamine N-acetyltransferase
LLLFGIGGCQDYQMTIESRHLSIFIERPPAEVYAFAADPANLPRWAAGLTSAVTLVDGQWVADSPMGRLVLAFAPSNDFGVLDHDVTLPTGETVRNPMRVLAAGEGCEMVFTVRRQPDMTEDAFATDCEAVAADLATLKQLLES